MRDSSLRVLSYVLALAGASPALLTIRSRSTIRFTRSLWP
jgi:hypothetical protein